MKERDLRLLVENRAAVKIEVEQAEGGFVVRVNGKALQSARQGVRPFAKLDTVAGFLADAGVRSFTVRLAG
jgi:hypothetical protein